MSVKPGKMGLPFILTPLGPDGHEPVWDGQAYHVGDQSYKVLEYSCTEKGWRDDLTTFHEEVSGSDHFIDVASRLHALGQIERFLKSNCPTILEIGCSSGEMLRLLSDSNPAGTTIGADIIKQPLEQLANRLNNIPLLRFDLSQCPLPDNCIDVVVALNVLEHIEHDDIAIAHLFRILKPDGIAILEVPAGPELYDNYDRMLMHYRRYNMKNLQSMMVKVGFRIEYASYLGCFLYPGFWMMKQISKLKTVKDKKVDSNAVRKNIVQTRTNKFFKAIIDAELALGKTVLYPFGIRCLLTCSKPR